MPARHPLARLLSLTQCVALLQGCAATVGSKGTDVVPISQPPRDSAAVAQRPTRPFRSSAPNEIVSEAAEGKRRLVVGDMLRTELVTTVEQGPPGILRVGVGARFHSHESREYYFRQLASAYHTWTADNNPLVIELWQGGRKIGEYTELAFLIGPRYTTPLECPENATTGLCGSLGNSGQQEPPPIATAPDQGAAPTQQAPSGQRSGFQFGLGLGGGAADLACHGCDFASETGFSGFLSLAASLGEKRAVGVETTGWTNNESGTTTQVYSVMAHVTEYLSPIGGLFLRAGMGVVGYHEDTDAGDRSANALGFSGRLGYEFGMGRVSLVPYVGLVRTFGGADVKVDGVNARLNVAISNVQFGLSIATH
jgi:hypothetical protein